MKEAGLAFLVTLVDKRVARQVGKRLKIMSHSPPRVADLGQRAGYDIKGLLPGAPTSVLLWMLEEDDPRINEWACEYYFRRYSDRWNWNLAVAGMNGGIDAGIRALKRRALQGDPFTHGRGSLELTRRLREMRERIPEAPRDPYLIDRLRGVWTMQQGWAVSDRLDGLTRKEWRVIAAADRQEPLPGYARWVLAVRVDCPPEVREQFGTHRKFTHRLRQAGIVSGPREYVEEYRPARDVLQVLEVGRALFPTRLAEAADVLRPLVRGELGGDEAGPVAAVVPRHGAGTHRHGGRGRGPPAVASGEVLDE